MNEMEQLAEFAYNIWRIAQYKLCRHDGMRHDGSYAEDEPDDNHTLDGGGDIIIPEHVLQYNREQLHRGWDHLWENEPDDDDEGDWEQRRGYSKEFFRTLASETVGWDDHAETKEGRKE